MNHDPRGGANLVCPDLLLGRLSKVAFAISCLIGGGWLLAALPSHAQEELQINQLTTGDQRFPNVAAMADGGFLVVWSSPISPGDDTDVSILGRRLDSLGAPVSDDFQVNTYTPNTQTSPDISVRSDGSFVIGWASNEQISQGVVGAVRARPYDSSGTPLGNDILTVLGPNILTSLTSLDVGASAGGTFVIAYSDFYYNYMTGYQGGTLVRQIHSSNGTLLDTDQLGGGFGQEVFGSLAGNDTHGFVLSSQSRDYFSQYSNARARRLDGNGDPVGTNIDLHSDDPFPFGLSGGNQSDTALAPDGKFVVVWNAYDSYEGISGTNIYGRSVDAVGTPDPAGSQVLNEHTVGTQESPRIARGADGTHLLVWTTSDAPDELGEGIRGRWLDADGRPISQEFAVNTYTTGQQAYPKITPSADERSFMVVWQSASNAGADSDGLSIRARRLRLPSLFLDGFESGDTSAWSSVSTAAGN